MSKRLIKSYTNEFKQDAIKYVDEHPEMKVSAVADRLGIPKETLYDWTKQSNRKKIFGEDAPTSGPLTEQEKELHKLQRENRDLKDALEVLKKAISILSD